MAVKKTKKRIKPKELTDKEYHFVLEYCKDWNGSRSARCAGYDKLKPQNARNTATQLLAKPHIKKEIDARKAEIKRVINIDVQDILTLCHEIMSADVTDYYDPDAYDSVKLSKNSSNKRAVQTLDITTKMTDSGDEIRHERITLRDPLKAAERAAKLLGLDKQPDDTLDKKIEVTVNIVNKDKKQ